jgi:hypothetical protein
LVFSKLPFYNLRIFTYQLMRTSYKSRFVCILHKFVTTYKLIVETTYKSTYVIYFHWWMNKYPKIIKGRVDFTLFFALNEMNKNKGLCYISRIKPLKNFTNACFFSPFKTFHYSYIQNKPPSPFKWFIIHSYGYFRDWIIFYKYVLQLLLAQKNHTRVEGDRNTLCTSHRMKGECVMNPPNLIGPNKELVFLSPRNELLLIL